NEAVKLEPNTVLKINLSSVVSDRKSNNPFDNMNPLTMQITESIGMNMILNNLKKASVDENIDGIYLNLSFVRAGMASLDEIRNALKKFKESGKYIIAYSDLFTQKAYYLASVADEIYMNPSGIFDFKGLRAEVMYYKAAFDKFGIEPQIIRHGKYKSAIEPYERTDMSRESKEQVLTYISSVWNNILTGISEERDISVAELNKYADDLTVKNAKKALEHKFIDGIKYEDEVINFLKKKTAVLSNEVKTVSMGKYSRVPEIRNNKEFTRDRIAVVYASGTIGMGEGREGSIGAKRISRAIVKARRNSKVKAIVIRVNSGGGDVLSSEIIWREVLLASKSKPVIASMGDYAASGGYYILSPVSKIVAGKNTLTGSIGVFGVLFTTKKLMNNKLGITVDGVQTNKNSGTGSVFRPFTEYEKKVLQASVDDTYSTFLDRVAEGRNMNRDEVDKIGQGRIWTGEDAKKIGLIDEFGGLEKAISIAAEEAGIENYRLLELPALTDPFTALLNSIGSFSKLKQFKNPLFENFNPAETMEDLFELKGLQLRIPYKFEVY
ncbi:signal peptide peptidase SppA, partial [Bacteroidota bacterium]